MFEDIKVILILGTLMMALAHPSYTGSKLVFVGAGLDGMEFLLNNFHFYTDAYLTNNEKNIYTNKSNNILASMLGDVIPVQTNSGTMYVSVGDLYWILGGVLLIFSFL
ncbi:MAG: hypothetical protein QXE51_02720 [Nitrososphaeria archaeon]